jgi:hypothetical protein
MPCLSPNHDEKGPFNISTPTALAESWRAGNDQPRTRLQGEAEVRTKILERPTAASIVKLQPWHPNDLS